MKRLEPDGYVGLFAPILEARPEVRFAWLFGSAARGEMNAESDIDVAVSLEPGSDDWEFRLRAMRELGAAARTDEVHVAVLEKVPLPLRAKVVREGLLLVERRPRERRTFERYTLLRWWDEAPRARWTARMLTDRLIAEGRIRAPELAHRAERLRAALDYLAEAAEIASSPGLLRDDATLRMAVERAFQVAVEALLDLASALVVRRGWERPEAGSESFLLLARHGVLDDEEAGALGDWVRFRNLLVHEYASIDLDRVHAILREKLDDLRRLTSRILEEIQPLILEEEGA